jgi:uncharacterized protein YjbI with pentapeptide repeats
MANAQQLSILNQGVDAWNKWRAENPSEDIDLSEADLKKAALSRADLRDVDLHRADLSQAALREARLYRSDLSEADLSRALVRKAELWRANLSNSILWEADLSGANLSDTDLRGSQLNSAILSGANLNGANLSHANLGRADLTGTSLTRTIVHDAIVSGCSAYGISVWDLVGEFKEQRDLIITPRDAPVITVDNIKVAQFIYLVLNNEEIRDVINTLTSKSVLILGRFSIPERKALLDALRNKLRAYNLLPIVFDFDRPTNKDFTETIKTLAGLSYFVIADITNPRSSPLELQATVPDYQIPFVPIIQEGERPFAMMVDLQKKYPWVLPTRSYDSIETLMAALKPGIIDPAVETRNKLRLVKAQEQVTESLKDYLDKSL